ncbi:hypothetical protein HYU19_02660 [Candidatus Woesearchaeota archaeon]|nr:hypothetical protein [Candidatus Woesearchaeota archaeon]
MDMTNRPMRGGAATRYPLNEVKPGILFYDKYAYDTTATCAMALSDTNF